MPKELGPAVGELGQNAPIWFMPGPGDDIPDIPFIPNELDGDIGRPEEKSGGGDWFDDIEELSMPGDPKREEGEGGAAMPGFIAWFIILSINDGVGLLNP